MAEQIIIVSRLTLEDFCKMQHQFSRRATIIATLFLPIVFINIAFSSIKSIPWQIAIIIFIALAIATYFLLLWATNKQSKKQYASNNFIHDEITYTFTAEDIFFSARSENGHIRWEELYCAMEFKNGIMLFISNQVAWFIPNSIFQTEDDLNVLRRYIKKVPKRKRNWLGRFK